MYKNRRALYWTMSLFVLALIFTLRTTGSQAENSLWSNDTKVNTPICTSIDKQVYQRVISDGSGGVIVVWEDNRTGSSDIYAQRINATGNSMWSAQGLPICVASDKQITPEIVTDGSGGAIIVWADNRTGQLDIYAQRVSAEGTIMWTTNGLVISANSAEEDYPMLCSDGAGGAILTWVDFRQYSTNGYDIYAQRIDASGKTMWNVNGVTVCTAPKDQGHPIPVSDGSGGAIIVWIDGRTYMHVYAQKVGSSGTLLWTLNGVLVCPVSSMQQYPQIVSDGSAGAIIAWYDNRSGNNDIYSQRVNSSGSLLWSGNGLTICSAAGNQVDVEITSDGNGGAIICWDDNRNTDIDIYAQRVNDNGTCMWSTNGIPVSKTTGNQSKPIIAGDGSGGAYIAWEDSRLGATTDIYMQRINASGASLWSINGLAICSSPNNQSTGNTPVRTNRALVSDEFGGAIIAWEDYRNGNADVYSQKILGSGNFPSDQFSTPNNPTPIQPPVTPEPVSVHFTTTGLTSGVIGTPYSVQLSASGGTAPYKYIVFMTSALPKGLTLSLTGLFSGTPLEAFQGEVELMVSDAIGTYERKKFAMSVTTGESTTPTPAITPTTPTTDDGGGLKLRCVKNGIQIIEAFPGDTFTVQVKVQPVSASSGGLREGDDSDGYIAIYSDKHKWEMYMAFDQMGNPMFKTNPSKVAANWKIAKFDWTDITRISIPDGDDYYIGSFIFKGYLCPANTDHKSVQASTFSLKISTKGTSATSGN